MGDKWQRQFLRDDAHVRCQAHNGRHHGRRRRKCNSLPGQLSASCVQQKKQKNIVPYVP